MNVHDALESLSSTSRNNQFDCCLNEGVLPSCLTLKTAPASIRGKPERTKMLGDLPSPRFLSRGKLKFDEAFEPCVVRVGEEIFLNGIFEFNISRLLAFLDAHAERFPIETIEIAAISNYPRDEEAVHGV
jgi:hypothetical protein